MNVPDEEAKRDGRQYEEDEENENKKEIAFRENHSSLQVDKVIHKLPTEVTCMYAYIIQWNSLKSSTCPILGVAYVMACFNLDYGKCQTSIDML